jgi:hypothetical protein
MDIAKIATLTRKIFGTDDLSLLTPKVSSPLPLFGLSPSHHYCHRSSQKVRTVHETERYTSRAKKVTLFVPIASLTLAPPAPVREKHKVADTYAKWGKMGVKQQISFLKSCFLLDEVDRVEVMQSYADEIEVFICFASPTTAPLPHPTHSNLSFSLSHC